jgi:hypothetical protein
MHGSLCFYLAILSCSDRFVLHWMVWSWAPKRNQGRRDRHWRTKRTHAALMTSALDQSRRFRDAPEESGPPPITDIRCQRLIISVAAWAYQRRCRLCCRPVPRCAATLPIAHRYSCPAPPRRASSTPYRFPLAGARFHPARADRDLPAAFLGAAAFAQGVLQGLSSDDPVRFGPFPSRYRCRFRLMLVERSHHRDMRHHRITAVLADQYQHFGCRLPLRRLLFGFGQFHDEAGGVAQCHQRFRSFFLTS